MAHAYVCSNGWYQKQESLEYNNLDRRAVASSPFGGLLSFSSLCCCGGWIYECAVYDMVELGGHFRPWMDDNSILDLMGYVF